MTTRIYRLWDKHGHIHLIEASTAAQAFMHLAKSSWEIRVATAKDVAALAGQVTVDVAQKAKV